MNAIKTEIEAAGTWTAPIEVNTKFGARLLRKSHPTEALSKLWEERKDEVKAAGVSWGKDRRGEWEMCWWLPLDAAVKQARVAAIEASRAVSADVSIPVPDGLDYMPFQRAGIAYALSRPGVLIGDEMGLGKTVQAIGVVNADPTVKRVLVICPASLKVNWAREFKRWSVRPLRIAIADGKSCPASITDVLIVNYDVLAKHAQALRASEWDLLIVDECHYTKNPAAKRSRQVWGGDDRHGDETPIPAKRRIALSGTPILNRPVEAWTTLHAIAPQEFPKFFPFALRYCAAVRSRWGWDFSGSSNLDELQEKLRRSCMVRRLKRDVLTELPPKRRQIIEVAPNGCAGLVEDEARQYAEHESKIEALRAAAELAKAGDDEAAYDAAVAALTEATKVAFTAMAKVRHDLAVAKVPKVVEHVKDCIEGGADRIVVFVHHHDVAHAIELEFGGDVITITGETAPEKRQGLVDAFNARGGVLLLGIHAAGVGLSVKASHEVFAELDWVPGVLTQAEDRCHGIGRGIEGEPLLVQHLVIDGSLDARMAKTLVEKQAMIDAALDKIAVKKDDGMLFPARERAATENVGRKALDEAAAKLTDDQRIAIHEALKRLAGMCDNARTLDGHGFSKIDVAIGHSLAEAPFLTKRQAALGLKIALKYRRQLGDELTGRIKGND